MIIKDILKLKEYVGLNSQTDVSIMSAHIKSAQAKFIVKFLGYELTKLLDDYVETDGVESDPTLDALLPYVERPLSFFAYMIATPFLDVVLTNSGFAVQNSNNLAPASEKRVSALKDGVTEQAHDGIEQMLLFIERNVSDYPLWVNSDAYFLRNEVFVRTASDFNKICDIDSSRIVFLKMQPIAVEIEQLEIEPLITSELADLLRQEAAVKELSQANKLIYELLQRAVAHKSYARYFNKPEHAGTGELYLSRAVNIILANPENYPVATSLFPTDRTRRPAFFTNSEDYGFFVS